MATRGRWSWWLLAVAAVSTWWQPANSEPQINLLNKGCSQYKATNIAEFSNNLNATFSDLRSQLSIGRRFATAQRGESSDEVYCMAQCRNYMSEADCLACYDYAVSQMRNCSNNGARVVYDGCFLRYESYDFYAQTIQNTQICGVRTAPRPNEFAAEAQALLRDLELATPRINGYFAATKREVSNGDGNLAIYGVAQCAQTVSQNGCQGCLTAAYETIQACLPNAEGRLTDAACFMRYSDAPFFADNQTIDITTLLAAGGGKSSKNKAIIGGVVGGAGLALIIFALILWYMFTRKLKIATRGNILGATELQRPNAYSYKDLKAATNNFSKENKLGEGSFGVVHKVNTLTFSSVTYAATTFRGNEKRQLLMSHSWNSSSLYSINEKVATQQATLKNGNIVAVKKLDITYSRAKADFESEGRLISNVHHRNLVRLLGCCSKGTELLLVYEYMENGSLDRFLYGDKRGSLTWKQRIDIIFGTARGIAYLHEHYHVTIIHRDIKPSNILLDDNFQAKIADFGLARLLPESQSHVSTKFAGTLGYTAPEYAINGHLSEKVDTYSFGVVILEIISGRRCNHMNEDSDSGYLLEEAWKLYESGMHHKLADEQLDSNEYELEDLKKMVEVALLCMQSPPSSRPTMSEVLAMISSDRSVEQRAQRRPSFWYGDSVVGETASIPMGSSASAATASISHFTGR